MGSEWVQVLGDSMGCINLHGGPWVACFQRFPSLISSSDTKKVLDRSQNMNVIWADVVLSRPKPENECNMG